MNDLLQRSISCKTSPIKNWVMAVLAVLFLIVMHIVVPNGGGVGVDLPGVLLCWAAMILLMTGIWVGNFHKPKLVLSSTARIWFVACILMSLPVIWCPHKEWLINGAPRIAGMWGGMLFFITLQQIKINLKQWNSINYFIISAVFIQVIFTLAEMFYPMLVPPASLLAIANGQRGYSVFQQPNVAASFFSTGLAFIFWYAQDKSKHCTDATCESFRLAALCLLATAIGCLLILLRSRVGWVAGGIVFLGWLYIGLKDIFAQNNDLFHRWAVLLFFITGVLLGYRLLQGTMLEALHSHDGSNYQRMLTLKETAMMILQRPLTGWGLGSFEYSFQHYLISHATMLPSQEVMAHPHNEIIYWWVEGGIVSLAGICLLAYGGVKLILNSKGIANIALVICALPILLHTQLELPLYESVIHWLILLLVLCQIDINAGEKHKSFNLSVCGRVFVIILLGMGMSYVVSGFYSQIVLTRFESRELKNDADIENIFNKWCGSRRYNKDLTFLQVIFYQKKHQSKYLRNYTEKADEFSATWIDADIIDNEINILQAMGDVSKSSRLKSDARKLFPMDERFNSGQLRDSFP